MSKLVQNYLLQEPIGKGVYGKVYRCVHQKSKQQYAIKVITKSVFQQNPRLQQLAINEIKILSSLKSKYIVKFVETLKTPNNFYFVYEYCNGGALDALLAKKKILKENESLKILGQLIEAFKELNKNSVMHRDLKPDNIFLSDGNVKLGDFGFCKFLEVNMAQTMLGSPIYMAPEILREEIYTSKADIWSLGIVLFEMLYGYCPYESSSISQLINVLKETQLVLPEGINEVSEETKELLRRMLVKDQFKRIEWVDLFDYKIDEEGKMIGPSKKDYTIENLENYFLFNNHSVNSTPPQSEVEIVKTISSFSPQKIHSPTNNLKNQQVTPKTELNTKIQQRNEGKNCQKNQIKKSLPSPDSSEASLIPFNNTKSHEVKNNTNFTANALNKFPSIPLNKLKTFQEISVPNKLPQSSKNIPYKNVQIVEQMELRNTYSSSNPLPFTNSNNTEFTIKKQQEKSRNSTSILTVDTSNKKNKQFQQKHKIWNQAIDLMLEISQSSSQSSQKIIQWVILCLLNQIKKQSQTFTQWVDILTQQKKLLMSSLRQLNQSFKQNKDIEDGKNEILKLWKKIALYKNNSSNYSYTKESNSQLIGRAIRFMYGNSSNQDSSIEQLLLS